MDMLQWLIGGTCRSVSSYGSLSFFTEENAPEGSTARCIDGCKVEHECPYSAIKMYLNEKEGWPQNIVSLDPSYGDKMNALIEGPYGRCIYRCDNDVVDHLVVNLLFEDDVTVAFTMTAFTHDVSRTFKIMGTTSELRGHYRSIRYLKIEAQCLKRREIHLRIASYKTFIVMATFLRRAMCMNLIDYLFMAIPLAQHRLRFAKGHPLHVKMEVIENIKGTTVLELVSKWIEEQSVIQTDAYRSFPILETKGYNWKQKSLIIKSIPNI